MLPCYRPRREDKMSIPEKGEGPVEGAAMKAGTRG